MVFMILLSRGYSRCTSLLHVGTMVEMVCNSMPSLHCDNASTTLLKMPFLCTISKSKAYTLLAYFLVKGAQPSSVRRTGNHGGFLILRTYCQTNIVTIYKLHRGLPTSPCHMLV